MMVCHSDFIDATLFVQYFRIPSTGMSTISVSHPGTAGLKASLYRLGAESTENTASHDSSVVVCVYSLVPKRVHRAAP
jgi:hypothetical protein